MYYYIMATVQNLLFINLITYIMIYENIIIKEINIIWKEIIIVYYIRRLCFAKRKSTMLPLKKKRVVYNICF